MNDNHATQGRRSTRLYISIPIVITAKDAGRNPFQENTRTLVVNKHGAKIVTTHQLKMGTEVLIENRALGTSARSTVVWLGDTRENGSEVGLQLTEAENIWGVEFPPSDWSAPPLEEESPSAIHVAANSAPAPAAASVPPRSANKGPAATRSERVTPPPPEEPNGTRASGNSLHPQKVVEQIGLEMEVDWGQSPRAGAEEEGKALREQVQALSEQLSAVQGSLKGFEAQMQGFQRELQAVKDRLPQLSAEMHETRQQVVTLIRSALNALRRAAESGFGEYDHVLEKELQPMATTPASQEAKPQPPETPHDGT